MTKEGDLVRLEDACVDAECGAFEASLSSCAHLRKRTRLSEERPNLSVSAIETRGENLIGSVQKYEYTGSAHGVERIVAFKCAASERNDGARVRASRCYRASFTFAKAALALAREDLGDRHACFGDDHRVGVERNAAVQLCDERRDR
jgi:hypothetical protein